MISPLAVANSLTSCRSLREMTGQAFRTYPAPDVEVVLVSQQVRAGGTHVALNGRRAPGEQKHNVFPELRQFPLIARSKAFADPHQEQERSHSPGNAEHSQKRAQLVRPEIAKDLREDVQDGPHHRPTKSELTVILPLRCAVNRKNRKQFFQNPRSAQGKPATLTPCRCTS